DAMRAAVAQTRDVRHFTGEPVEDHVLADAVAGAGPFPGQLETITGDDRVGALLPHPGEVTGATALVIAHVDERSAQSAVAAGAALQNVRVRLAAEGVGSMLAFPAEPGPVAVVAAGVPAELT